MTNCQGVLIFFLNDYHSLYHKEYYSWQSDKHIRLWNRYSFSEIAACVNDAREKLMKECFVRDKVLESCSVCFFACGFERTFPVEVIMFGAWVRPTCSHNVT